MCATGKNASELLALCRARLTNDPATERGVVLDELAKINRIRLRQAATGGQMSLSTHVLDATTGQPARGVSVTVERSRDGTWTSTRGGGDRRRRAGS